MEFVAVFESHMYHFYKLVQNNKIKMCMKNLWNKETNKCSVTENYTYKQDNIYEFVSSDGCECGAIFNKTNIVNKLIYPYVSLNYLIQYYPNI